MEPNVRYYVKTFALDAHGHLRDLVVMEVSDAAVAVDTAGRAVRRADGAAALKVTRFPERIEVLGRFGEAPAHPESHWHADPMRIVHEGTDGDD